jgi:mRNA-degrading endonuclease YafQ of YafQ-DinJ toxin-antitoxin module
MRIALTARFQRDVRSLRTDEREAVFRVIRALPEALGRPHLHSGHGLRKIHRSGIWEARVGLSLRIVFGYRDDCATLSRVGTHDDVRRYLRSL